MAFRFVLLALPALALARIDVDVAGKFEGDQPDMKVYFSGSQVDIISEKERSSFSLGDNNLKNGVNGYFGRRPDEAYLRSPTPWGDLYQTNSWSQVIRTLIPKRGKILQVSTKPLIVMQQIFENNSTKDATFNVGISHAVENTVSSSWSNSEELTVEQDISYGFDIELANVGGSTAFSYTSAWGRGTEKSQTVTIGATSAMEVLLSPGQSVVTELHANRGTIQIEMEYEASLSGAVAVNYDDGYRGHHFWALDVNAVMAYAGLKQQLMSKEIIEISFYAQSRVIVRDTTMGHKLINVAL